MDNNQTPYSDPYIRYIRQPSSINPSDLFASYSHDPIKVEEPEFQPYQQVYSQSLRDQLQKGDENQIQLAHKKKKVYYLDKMSMIMKQGKISPQYKYAEPAPRTKKGLDKEQQLERNRESARNSRKRKKQYIETLEEKNTENQMIISDLKKRLHQVQMERDRLKQENGSHIKTFITTKNEAFENLSKVLNKHQNSNEHISESLKVMKAKYGAAGSERISTTDYYMKQIIEMLLADVHKYLMECVSQNAGLFGLGAWNQLDDNIAKVLGVQKSFRINLNKNYGMEMSRQFDRFKEVTHRFYGAYREVQKQAKVIEKIFDNISLEFNDESIADLLLWLEQHKFLKQIKKMRSRWTQAIEEPRDEPDIVRKRCKLQ